MVHLSSLALHLALLFALVLPGTFRANAQSGVGIGTTTPTEKLDVVGNAKVSQTVFARALTGLQYETITGPGTTASNQRHVVQCTAGWAITSLRVYASSQLDGNMQINCVNLNGILQTDPSALSNYVGPAISADNQRHDVQCGGNQIATGWSIYSSNFLDGEVGLQCRTLAPGYTRTGQIETTQVVGGLPGNAPDNVYQSASCMPGTFMTAIHIYASNRLETITEVYCAGVQVP